MAFIYLHEKPRRNVIRLNINSIKYYSLMQDTSGTIIGFTGTGGETTVFEYPEQIDESIRLLTVFVGDNT